MRRISLQEGPSNPQFPASELQNQRYNAPPRRASILSSQHQQGSQAKGQPLLRPYSTQLHDHSQNTASPPPPLIPPRPEVFRRHLSATSVSQQATSTPTNILDLDDGDGMTDHPQASTSASPAPPRPINPGFLNLRRALYSQITYHHEALQAHFAAENIHLRALHTDLLKGEPAILDEMARLEAVRDVCATVRDRMQIVVDEAERNTQDLDGRKEVEVDELVCGTNVVHNQYVERAKVLVPSI